MRPTCNRRFRQAGAISARHIGSETEAFRVRTFSKFLIGAAGVAALAGAAFAADRNAHLLKVVLPDGSVEQIHYIGDVAPQVVVVPTRQTGMPVAFVDPFAAMDRA